MKARADFFATGTIVKLDGGDKSFYRVTDIQAGIGNVQLEEVEKRRNVWVSKIGENQIVPGDQRVTFVIS